jgi:hypothetical protein
MFYYPFLRLTSLELIHQRHLEYRGRNQVETADGQPVGESVKCLWIEGCVTPNIAGLLKIMNHLRVFKLDWHKVSAGTFTSRCQDMVGNLAEAIGNRLQVLSLVVDWHGTFMKL